MHGRLDLPDLAADLRAYPDAAVTRSAPASGARCPGTWVGNVYHGLDLAPFPSGQGTGGYFAFLGRIAPDKDLSGAIAIARAPASR